MKKGCLTTLVEFKAQRDDFFDNLDKFDCMARKIERPNIPFKTPGDEQFPTQLSLQLRVLSCIRDDENGSFHLNGSRR